VDTPKYGHTDDGCKRELNLDETATATPAVPTTKLGCIDLI